MKFTATHVVILDRHREHWDTLKTAGYMKNIDRSVFDELVKVYREAIADVSFTHWCGACVAGMVRGLYTAYERWQEINEAGAAAVCSAAVGVDKRRSPFHKSQGGKS